MRILGKVVLLLVAAVVAVVQLLVAAYGVTGVRDSIEVRQHARQARADLQVALPAARTTAAEWQRRQAATHGTPAYAWTELRCGFDSVDAGWIVQYYEQRCDVHSVAMWPSDRAVGGCTEEGDGVLAPTSALGEQAAWPCPRNLTAPPAYGGTRLLDGERPRDLTASTAWEVAENGAEVSRTEIGCDPWAVIFCSEPMDEPAM